MKKFYGACIALLLCLCLVFAGCTSNSAKVLNYLKEGKEFREKSTDSGKYRITLTVNDDLSYALSVFYGSDALKSYEAEGTQLEYLACYEEQYSSEWLGVSQNNVSYNHVVKLPEATVEINGETNVFYLIALASSKNSDSYSLSLVYYTDLEISADNDENLKKILNSQPSFSIRKA